MMDEDGNRKMKNKLFFMKDLCKIAFAFID